MIIGDITSKVGNDNKGHEFVMGKKTMGKKNDNGNRLVEFLELKELTISGVSSSIKIYVRKHGDYQEENTENGCKM